MPAAADPPTSAFVDCWQRAERVCPGREFVSRVARPRVGERAAGLDGNGPTFLPRYLVFAASGLRNLLVEGTSGPLPSRNKSLRARERHLLLYLQRVCGKNDTLSEFGPHGWGTAEPGVDSLRLVPEAGIARREVFPRTLDRARRRAAVNADPLIKIELPPRLHPHGRLENMTNLLTPRRARPCRSIRKSARYFRSL